MEIAKDDFIIKSYIELFWNRELYMSKCKRGKIKMKAEMQ